MDNQICALAIDSSGNIYAGGDFTTAGGVAAKGIAKWNGSSWSAVGGGVDGTSFQVASIVISKSGTLYAGGYFTKAGGNSVNYVAKWDGSAWSALGTDVNNGVNAPANCLALDASDNLYVGGNMTLAGGTVSVKYLAKWNGSVWSALSSQIDDGFVSALAFDSSGAMYAGGAFKKAGGVTVNHVAKWNGSAWSALGMGVYDTVYSFAFDSSRALYAGGLFKATSAGDVVLGGVGKWDGTAWTGICNTYG